MRFSGVCNTFWVFLGSYNFFNFSVGFPWANLLSNWAADRLRCFLVSAVIHINDSCGKGFSYLPWSVGLKGEPKGTCGVAIVISKFILSILYLFSREQLFHAVSLRLGLSLGYVVILFNILEGRLLQNPYVFRMNVPFVNQQSHEEKLGPLALNKGYCACVKCGSILTWRCLFKSV